MVFQIQGVALFRKKNETKLFLPLSFEFHFELVSQFNSSAGWWLQKIWTSVGLSMLSMCQAIKLSALLACIVINCTIVPFKVPKMANMQKCIIQYTTKEIESHKDILLHHWSVGVWRLIISIDGFKSIRCQNPCETKYVWEMVVLSARRFDDLQDSLNFHQPNNVRARTWQYV